MAALAHELAHQRLGHSIAVWQYRLHSSEPGSSVPLAEGQWDDRLLGPNGLMYYGAGREREADQVALSIMYNSGYDPRAMLSFMQLLIGAEQSSARDMAGLLSLHPPSLQRLNWSKVEANKLPPVRDAKLDSGAFSQLRKLLKIAEKQGKVRRPIESGANFESEFTKP